MNDNYSYEQVKALKQELHDRTRHSYLSTYLGVPEVDEEKLIVLHHMLEDTKHSADKANLYIIVTMLVQLALDTHDGVSLKKPVDELDKKKRQLTVLAGDYFSSLYYRLLSERNETFIIKLLSQSIQEINESKMALYQWEIKHQTIQQAFSKLRTVESGLLQKLADYFGLPAWKEFAEEYFFLRRLLKERTIILLAETKSSETTAEMHGTKLPSDVVKSGNFLRTLDEYITKTRFKVEQFFSKHPRVESKVGKQVWNTREMMEKTAGEG